MTKKIINTVQDYLTVVGEDKVLRIDASSSPPIQ